MPFLHDVIDLRSDANTLPTATMRMAMVRARVGDDQYGEDPSVNTLEMRVANLLGKEAALFVASGTMANQIALQVLARRGDEVVVRSDAHFLWHETGAAAALAGVQIVAVGATGVFDVQSFRATVKRRDNFLIPSTGLEVIEDTHNRDGGLIFPQDDAVGVCAAADDLGMLTLLDGARLFNAACVTGLSVEEMARPFRMARIALSKGLGCPVGSVIAGTGADIAAARRVRRMMGGATRQAGFLAAAGLYALEHNVDRICDNHINAPALAEVLSTSSAFEVDIAAMQTNIVIARIAEGAVDAGTMVERARAAGVLILALGPRTIRAETYLGVGRRECVRAAELLIDSLRC